MKLNELVEKLGSSKPEIEKPVNEEGKPEGPRTFYEWVYQWLNDSIKRMKEWVDVAKTEDEKRDFKDIRDKAIVLLKDFEETYEKYHPDKRHLPGEGSKHGHNPASMLKGAPPAPPTGASGSTGVRG